MRTHPDHLAHLTDTAAPLQLLNLRIPAPVLERLGVQAVALNANRAAVARHALRMGLEQLEQQTTAASPLPVLIEGPNAG